MQWYIVGPYSAITAPAASSGPQRARDAPRTASLSMCSPGTTTRNFTPRFIASIKAALVRSSGTKYAADRSIERDALVIASRYINCMLSLPPLGELLNICASVGPDGCEYRKVVGAMQHGTP